MNIPFIDGAGRESDLEVTVRLDTVECHSGGRCRAVFDRDIVRDWLDAPFGLLAADDVMFSTSLGGLAVAIEGLLPWRMLPAHLVADLRSRV